MWVTIVILWHAWNSCESFAVVFAISYGWTKLDIRLFTKILNLDFNIFTKFPCWQYHLSIWQILCGKMVVFFYFKAQLLVLRICLYFKNKPGSYSVSKNNATRQNKQHKTWLLSILGESALYSSIPACTFVCD